MSFCCTHVANNVIVGWCMGTGGGLIHNDALISIIHLFGHFVTLMLRTHGLTGHFVDFPQSLLLNMV